MEAATPDILSSLLALGLPGVVIIGLAWAYLQEKKEKAELQARLDVVQEKRLEEATRAVANAENTASVLQGMTELIRTLQPRGRASS